MKKLLLFILTFILVYASRGYSSAEYPYIEPVVDFEENPTAENFALIDDPTAEQLYLLSDPQPNQFLLLSPQEQDFYIDRLFAADYSKSGNRLIARNFFYAASDNLNSHQEAFLIFLQEVEEVDINEFSSSGGLSLDTDDVLKGATGSVSLRDFKRGTLLSEKYNLLVRNSQFYIIPKGSNLEVPFTGDLHKDGEGKFALSYGSIDGKKIIGGKALSLDKEMKITGKAKSFSGVSFVSATHFDYAKDKNVLTLDRAEILSLDETTEVFLRGSAIIKNYDKIKGKLSVLQKSKCSINNFEISAGQKDVELKFQPEISEEVDKRFGDLSKEELPSVVFSDAVEVNGEVTVKVNEFDIRGNKYNVDPSSLSIQSIPNIDGRTYFKLGDQFKAGTGTFSQLVDIKKVLNSWYESKFDSSYFSEKEINDGEYNAATSGLVKLFQQEYNQQVLSKNKIAEDGQWGKGTFNSYTQLVGGSKLGTKNFVIESKSGGKSIVSYNSGQINIDTAGDVSFTTGNKHLDFDSENNQLYKVVGQSLAINLDSDVKLNFRDENGVIIDTVTAKAKDYTFNKLQGSICLECALADRLDLKKANCAGFVQQDTAINLLGTELADKKIDGESVLFKLGYYGSSWQMGRNIKGELVYKRETELSPEEQRLLFEVEKAANEKYRQFKGQGLSDKIITKRIRNDDITVNFPPDLKRKYEGQSLQKIHDKIFKQELTSFKVESLENDDYIGLYHYGSNYLGEASIKGQRKSGSDLDDSMENNRHTHSANGYWGEKTNLIYDYEKAPAQTLINFLKQNYELKNDASLSMLGIVYVQDPIDGNLRKTELASNGQFYFSSDLDSSRNPLPGKKRVIMLQDTEVEVQPYMVQHLDGRVYDEPLAKTIDGSNSLYMVKKPDEKLREEVLKQVGITSEMFPIQIKEKETVEEALRRVGVPENNLATLANHVRKVNGIIKNEPHVGDVILIPGGEEIKTSSGKLSMGIKLREEGIPNPEKWAEVIFASSPQRIKEYNLDPLQESDLAGLTAGIIQRESTWGTGPRYRIKSQIRDVILPDFVLSSTDAVGYSQVHVGTAQDLAQRFGEEFDVDELNTEEGSVKYAQRVLAQAFQLYAPSGRPLTREEKEIIAVTYNTGLMKPRNAALQVQLKDLGYIPEGTEPSGNIGPATTTGFLKLAQDIGYSITEPEIVNLMGQSQRNKFEQSKLYLALKERWKEKYKGEPKYAVMPQYSNERIHTGVITSKGYAEEVVATAEELI